MYTVVSIFLYMMKYVEKKIKLTLLKIKPYFDWVVNYICKKSLYMF